MRKSHEVIAILCSDIHLSSQPPIARSVEPDWFAAMDRQLKQLRKLQRKYDCPVVCAGDVFDRWNSTPELINFAIDKLPHLYAVPGQHDLPNHSMAEIKRSAYWTLVEAKKIEHLDGRVGDRELTLYGFGWEQELHGIEKCDKKDDRIKLAVVHRYCWNAKRTSYPGAPEEGRADKIIAALKGMDAIVTGDNHKGFCIGVPGDPPYLSNPGTFFRRKTDEISHIPNVGLLLRSGVIEPFCLDCSEDKFIDIEGGLKLLEQGLDLTTLVSDLKSLGNGTLDFLESLSQYLEKNNIPKSVRKIIMKASKSESK